MSPEWLPKREDVTFYEENGYWISPKVISDDRLEKYIAHMNDVYDGKFETGRSPWTYWQGASGLRQTNNSHWADDALRELVTDRVIGAIAAALMQTDTVKVWHDQLLYKPGDGGAASKANVGWHQDYHYWQCAAEPTMITAWIAFDDVHVSNGCMQVVPGSHSWGLVDVNDFYEDDLEKQEREMTLPEGQNFKPVPLEMKAGQVSFHHAMTMHGSGPNLTLLPRRSLTVHLMAGNTRYRAGTSSDNHMNVQLAKPRDGDIFTGEWFPLAYGK